MLMKRGRRFMTNEGYIGAEKKAEILFILREPNTGGQRAALDEFWFRDQVVASGGRVGKAYFCILGRLARILLHDEAASYESLLRRCAYINLYPYSGTPAASKNYVNFRKQFADRQCQREQIIQRAKLIEEIKPDRIVTCCDIYEAMKRRFGFENERVSLVAYKQRRFHVCDMQIGEKRVTVCEFYHPCRHSEGKIQVMAQV